MKQLWTRHLRAALMAAATLGVAEPHGDTLRSRGRTRDAFNAIARHALTTRAGRGAVAQPPAVEWHSQSSGVTSRLRGVSAVSPDVAWASGGNGTVLRTVDGGRSWQLLPIPGAETLDFRDVDAMSDRVAHVLSIGAGAASRIYTTTDGGARWDLWLAATTGKNPRRPRMPPSRWTAGPPGNSSEAFQGSARSSPGSPARDARSSPSAPQARTGRRTKDGRGRRLQPRGSTASAWLQPVEPPGPPARAVAFRS